jgi:large subunit ribosomal protein L35
LSHCPEEEPIQSPGAISYSSNKVKQYATSSCSKTRKAVAKRLTITGTGKVLRRGAGRRHLLQGKSPKRRRSLGKAALVGPTDIYRIKQNLPFSH